MAGPSITAVMSTLAVTGGALFGVFYNIQNNQRANYAILNEKLQILDGQTSGQDVSMSSEEFAWNLLTISNSLEQSRDDCGVFNFGCGISADQFNLLGDHLDVLRCVRYYNVLDREVAAQAESEDATYKRAGDPVQENQTLAAIDTMRMSCEILLGTYDGEDVPAGIGTDATISADPGIRGPQPEPMVLELPAENRPFRLYVQYTSSVDDRALFERATQIIQGSRESIARQTGFAEFNAYGAEYVESPLSDFELRYLKTADEAAARKLASALREALGQGDCGEPVITNLSSRYENDPRVKRGTLELWFPNDVPADCRSLLSGQ